MSKCIKNYYDSGIFMTVTQTKSRVVGLTGFITSKRYFRRQEVLTREEREEVLLEMEIQLEIDYYEFCLFQIKKEEEIQE
jgi:hypothetical protein